MFPDDVGIAIVCGRVSGNLEDLDFDDVSFYRRCYELIKHQGGTELLDKLVIIQTPRPGVAVVYRCEGKVDRNQKLAWKLVDGKPEVAIETRGEGGTSSLQDALQSVIQPEGSITSSRATFPPYRCLQQRNAPF